MSEFVKDVTFVLAGVALAFGLLLLMAAPAKATAPLVVICESGSFDRANGTRADLADGYFVEAATCNLGDSNGRPVTVKVID